MSLPFSSGLDITVPRGRVVSAKGCWSSLKHTLHAWATPVRVQAANDKINDFELIIIYRNDDDQQPVPVSY